MTFVASPPPNYAAGFGKTNRSQPPHESWSHLPAPGRTAGILREASVTPLNFTFINELNILLDFPVLRKHQLSCLCPIRTNIQKMMSEIRYDDDDEEEEDGDDDDEGNHDSLHFPFPFSKIDAAVLYLPLRPWR